MAKNEHIKTTEEIKERFFDWKLRREEDKVEQWLSLSWLQEQFKRNNIPELYDTIRKLLEEIK